jgi:hypothetical protein
MKKPPFSQFIWILIILALIGSACTSTISNPTSEFLKKDIIATWEANYGKGITDTLVIRSDGTYKQLYEDLNTGYKFETEWNHWKIKRFSDGRVWLYLDGGRYYVSGERIGELDGKGDPCPEEYPNCIHGKTPRTFYDPNETNFSLEMLDRLVLTVRVSSKQTIILHHMWTTTDRGFGILGNNKEFFTKIEATSN